MHPSTWHPIPAVQNRDGTCERRQNRTRGEAKPAHRGTNAKKKQQVQRTCVPCIGGVRSNRLGHLAGHNRRFIPRITPVGPYKHWPTQGKHATRSSMEHQQEWPHERTDTTPSRSQPFTSRVAEEWLDTSLWSQFGHRRKRSNAMPTTSLPSSFQHCRLQVVRNMLHTIAVAMLHRKEGAITQRKVKEGANH